MAGDASVTVKAFSKNARRGGFAGAAHAGEKIGVVQAVLIQRVAERARNMFLSGQIGEGLRTVFARNNLIAHSSSPLP